MIVTKEDLEFLDRAALASMACCKKMDYYPEALAEMCYGYAEAFLEQRNKRYQIAEKLIKERTRVEGPVNPFAAHEVKWWVFEYLHRSKDGLFNEIGSRFFPFMNDEGVKSEIVKIARAIS